MAYRRCDDSDEAFTGALLEADTYLLIRSFLTTPAPKPAPKPAGRARRRR